MTDQEIRQYLRKKKRRKRIITRLLIFALMLAATVGSAFALGNKAGNKKYEAELAAVKPVAEDVPIVNAAMPQIGNQGGEPFWTWYGFSSRVDWCAIFVSWCEDQCGYIDAKTAPSFALVSDGSNWFMDRGQWLEPTETPQAGDLIFFDWEQDKSRDHVGIVTSVVDGKVFTVEGNSSDRCRQKRYAIGDPVIYGYAHIEG